MLEVTKSPAEFWRRWSRCTGSLTWRPATVEDVPAIDELRKTSERVTHESQRNPDLFRMPVVLTLVAEDAAGQIVDCLYLESHIELVKMAVSPESFNEVALLEPDLSGWLRSIGMNWVQVTTLPQHEARMAPGLSAIGFECLDRIFSFWRKRL